MSTGVVSERPVAHFDLDIDIPRSIKVSPDSQRVAYMAKRNKWFVVVDGIEGKQYDSLATGRGIIFDFSDGFRYLAVKGADIYFVEEKLK